MLQPSAPSYAGGESLDLLQQLSCLARLAGAGGEGLVVADIQGRCIFINELAAELGGGTTSEFANRAVSGYFACLMEHGRIFDASWREISGPLNIAGLVASQRRLRFHPVRYPGRDQHYRLVSYSLFDEAGALVGYAVFLRDITSMVQDQVLEDSLLSSVSHDLRTPLMVIKAAVTGLLQEELQWDEALRRETLQDINEETDRLTTLVSALLEMSRIQGGALHLQTEWCDLAEIIHTALDRLQKVTACHQVVYDVPSPLPLVQGDFMQLDRVLSNLIENAVKYSPGGTEIRVTVAVEGEEAQVSVLDQGYGVPPEERERIFEKFYRVKQRWASTLHDGDVMAPRDGLAERARPPLAGGSGLGLAICRGIVLAHRGRIWVEARPEGGSRFVFTLPVDPLAPMSGSVRESGPLAEPPGTPAAEE